MTRKGPWSAQARCPPTDQRGLRAASDGIWQAEAPRLPLQRHDYHYKRNGVVNLFMFFELMFFEPLAGWRTVMTRERRAKVDWADCMRRLLEEHDPDAEKVVLVMDNLNTHGLSTFYEAFAPKRSLRRRPADWPGGSNFTTPPSTAVG